jgi:hypothetical protein
MSGSAPLAGPGAQVALGWALAEDFDSPVIPGKPQTGSVILYLVDPLGGRYSRFT